MVHAPRQPGRNRARDHAHARDVERQVADIARTFHDILPRQRSTSVGCIYARFSTKLQDSVAVQVRTCYDAALKAGVFVPAENVAFDMAVSGRRDNRPGLARITDLLRGRYATVLLCLASSRLHRKQYLVGSFIDDLVVDCGARVILPASSIDIAVTDNWRLLFQVHGIIDEQVANAYAANISAAHIGHFGRGLVCSSYPFGYASVPSDAGVNRHVRPRNALTVAPAAAAVVRSIFVRYADGNVSMAHLVRDLNAVPGTPRPPRSPDGLWSLTILGRMLSNPIYRGERSYGRTKSVWSPSKDYSRQVPRPEPLRARHDEALRIVDDDLFDRVQARRARRSATIGRRPNKEGAHDHRPNALGGLFYRADHGRFLRAGGRLGKFLVCESCRMEAPADRPLFSMLNRERALRLTCSALAAAILGDAELVGMILVETRLMVWQDAEPDPGLVAALLGQIEKKGRAIDLLLEDAGDDPEEQRDAARRLGLLRRERAELRGQLRRIEEGRANLRPAPAEAEVRALLGQLGATLETGPAAGPEAAARLRQAMVLLTGGRIDLAQRGRPTSYAGWLEGRFVPCHVRLAAHILGRPDAGDDPCPGVTPMVIAYRDPTPAQRLADAAKALYGDGLEIEAVAAGLGIRYNLARLALAAWSARSGTPLPDGRARWASRPTPAQPRRRCTRFARRSSDCTTRT
jgi:DNA invertase Pin-like site-specific DNA recombinase